jgi:hypothetical protein
MNKRIYTFSPTTYRLGCAGATLSFTNRQNYINCLEEFRRKEAGSFLYFFNRAGAKIKKRVTG